MARAPSPIFDRMVFPDYQFREYPKWQYSPEGKALVVQNEEEEEALKGDWYNTPAEAKAAAKSGV